MEPTLDSQNSQSVAQLDYAHRATKERRSWLFTACALEAFAFVLFLALAWQSSTFPPGSLMAQWMDLYGACAFALGFLIATGVGLLALIRIWRGRYRLSSLPWMVVFALLLPIVAFTISVYVIGDTDW